MGPGESPEGPSRRKPTADTTRPHIKDESPGEPSPREASPEGEARPAGLDYDFSFAIRFWAKGQAKSRGKLAAAVIGLGGLLGGLACWVLGR
jgi:hypothetical protein